MGFVAPKRGIFESDAAPGHRAWIVYIAGVRQVRLEVPDFDLDVEWALMSLWTYLCAHDRHLRLVE